LGVAKGILWAHHAVFSFGRQVQDIFTRADKDLVRGFPNIEHAKGEVLANLLLPMTPSGRPGQELREGLCFRGRYHMTEWATAL